MCMWVCSHLGWFHFQSTKAKGKARRNLKIPSLLSTGVLFKSPERHENLFCFSRVLEKQNVSKLLWLIFLHTWPHTRDALVGVKDDLNSCTCHKCLQGTVIHNTTFYPLNTKDVTFTPANGIYQCNIKIAYVFIISFLAIVMGAYAWWKQHTVSIFFKGKT